MSVSKLLIANRGEIGVRIARAASELNIPSVAVYSEDDVRSRHVIAADEAHALNGAGVAPYLDMAQIIGAAKASGCDAIHPGYGFLSENAEFAAACAAEGITFVGPSAEVLALFGDKARARALAQQHDVPVLRGTAGASSLDEARDFLRALGGNGAVMVKALAGGGGRGMRVVRHVDELELAYRRCQAEARAAFGSDAVYIEQFIPRARHVEVQVVGDGQHVSHVWERECTLQRRHQKLVEIAPSPTLPAALRDALLDAAVSLAEKVGYRGLGTFEFLVDVGRGADEASFAFIEANPRLQVEHTVTEEVAGIDLVRVQLELARGRTLESLGLRQSEISSPRGYAIQLRVNMETMDSDGSVKPAGGTLTTFEPPSGPGVRVDTYGYGGYSPSPNFDSLLAKLIVHNHGDDYSGAVRRALRALAEFRVEGVATNLPFLSNLLRVPDVQANDVYTHFVDDHMATLTASPQRGHQPFFDADPGPAEHPVTGTVEAPAGTVAVSAPMLGTVVEVNVAEGDRVPVGAQIAVLDAMKMQHVITTTMAGTVRRLSVVAGDTVSDGQPIAFLEEGYVESEADAVAEDVDLDVIRPDLAEVLERQRGTMDQARPEAVARRHRIGRRTARENVDDLCDPGSFMEYGGLTYAAQRRRRSMDELIRISPADGLITGIATVNGNDFDKEKARCMVFSYDYTVFAGTQGTMNHKKTDRMLMLAESQRLPIVFFAEGGGGRPGDTDNATKVAGLDYSTFQRYAGLSGLVPRIAVVSGRCFAGNAALAGSSDIIIATQDTTIGMGGPAMIEGGGLGVFEPEEVGPVSVQEPNGVLDCVVEDDAAAVAMAKQTLSYFQGALPDWQCADQRLLRRSIPENRLRAYDVRALVDTLCDAGSVLELRPRYARGMITAFVRIEGRPMGLIANDPSVMAGAIDAQGADKAARFMQLCDAFDIPILSLCDTPGFMVGPEAEKEALVRRTSRMFVTAAGLTVPYFTIVLRKGYGLGALAMACGNFHAPVFTVSWPTGEFGGMGLEGAVRLGYRKELEAIEDPQERQAFFDKMVAEAYQRGKALSMAASLEIDAVIDPMESRTWIVRGLDSVPAPVAHGGKKRPQVDTW